MNKKKRQNRTVLITGVTSGIGQAIALKFAQEGWNIVGHYHSSKKKSDELKYIVQKFNVELHLLKVDFSSEEQVKAFVKRLPKFTIDSLVNNAGTYVVSRHFSQLSIAQIDKTFMVNVFAPMAISAQVFVAMKQQGFGRIVNISSIAAKYGGSAYSLHYGSSKRALEGITKTLAREGAQSNVLVNTIRPGVIDTDFHKKFPKDMEKRVSLIPMHRIGNPVEVAETVFYLGSDKNSYITNEVITIAGGE